MGNSPEDGKKVVRMRRAAIVLAAVSLLVGVFAAGMLTEQAISDDESGDEPAEISTAEHDRLVNACVDEGAAAGFCTTWISDIVRDAERYGESYEEIAARVNDIYEEAGTREREPEPARQPCTYGPTEPGHPWLPPCP
jgi:hypothetical protein